MMRYRKTALAAGGMLAAIGLAACTNVQPSLGQYAIVTGHGSLSTQQVESVVSPGDQVHLGSGSTVWYFPGNYRNYVTLPSNGDRNDPTAEITGPDPKVKGSVGMSDNTWSFVGFEVNPAITLKAFNYKIATAFLSFCLKYSCASTDAQNDTSNAGQVRSSDPGWENMLNEVMPRAIDDATRTAISTYGPDLWTNQGEWGEYGTRIASHLTAELEDLTGSTIPYFCGPGSTTGDCKQLSVTIQKVTPVDQDVVNAYNKQVSAQYSEQAGAARLRAAQEIYGSDANYFLGLQDTIGICQSRGVTCSIYVGNPPSAPR